jgi:hypothetical protein
MATVGVEGRAKEGVGPQGLAAEWTAGSSVANLRRGSEGTA